MLWKTGIGEKAAVRFWKKIDSGKDFSILYENSKDVFKDIPTNFDSSFYNEAVAKDSKRWAIQNEYVLKIKNALVEPERCIAIKEGNKIVAQSTILGNQYPFILPYLLKRNRATAIEEAVLYDGYASKNYYHHLLNAVNSIHMLEKVSLSPDIPFIINRACFESRYFQHLYQNSQKFRSINWLVQEPAMWFRVKNLYRMQCIHFDAEPWFKSKNLYNLKDTQSSKKVFLSRDISKYNRCLTNEVQIQEILAKLGFETVYAEHLTMDEQLELFQNTKYLVALHGAGLVQQLFMNQQEAHIIEVMPQNNLMPLYYWQAYTLGAKYFDVVLGNKLDHNNNYELDPELLEKAVIKMLDNKHPGKTYGNTSL